MWLCFFSFFVFALSFDSLFSFQSHVCFFQELYYFQNDKVFFFFFKNSLPPPPFCFFFLFVRPCRGTLPLLAGSPYRFSTKKTKSNKFWVRVIPVFCLMCLLFRFVARFMSVFFFFEIFSDSFHVLVIPSCMFRCSHVPFSFIFVFLHTFFFSLLLISHVSFVVIRLTSHLQLDMR